MKKDELTDLFKELDQDISDIESKMDSINWDKNHLNFLTYQEQLDRLTGIKRYVISTYK